MEFVRIDDLISYQIKGLWGEEFDESLPCTPVIKTNNMNYDGTINLDNLTYRNIKYDSILDNYLQKGDLLIEKSGGTKTHPVGYVTYFEGEEKKYVCNNFILGLRPDFSKVYPKYLFYNLKFMYENGNFSDCYNKTTGIQNLKVKFYLAKKIKLIELSKQYKIIEILDYITKQIIFLKNVLIDFDNIVKSQFIEMFGDVLYNTKNFEICCFGDYINQMNIGPFGSDLKNEDFVPEEDGYCMVYEQKHAIQKNMALECRYVDELKYNKLKRFDIGPGDIIVSCRGTIGECFVLPNDAPNGIIHPSLMMIKPKNIVNNRFLVFLLEHILEEQTEQGSGVKMAIKATELSKIKTIKPERNLQDQFINFVQQIDKSKYFGGVGLCSKMYMILYSKEL